METRLGLFQFKYLTRPAIFTSLLLLIPLVAMQFSDEVIWSGGDFLIAGILLFGTSLTLNMIIKTSSNTIYKFGVGLALFSGLFLVWVNLAVGLIGSENEPFNLAYFSVVIIGIVGAFFSNLKPQGLRNTLIAMSFSMVTIAIIALLTGMQYVYASSSAEIIRATIVFSLPFIVSALLFHKSVKVEESSS